MSDIDLKKVLEVADYAGEQARVNWNRDNIPMVRAYADVANRLVDALGITPTITTQQISDIHAYITSNAGVGLDPAIVRQACEAAGFRWTHES